MSLGIRSEKVSDIPKIDQLLNSCDFPQQKIKLVSTLRDQGALLYSLVAYESEQKTSDEKCYEKVVGHLSLNLVTIETEGSRSKQVLCINSLCSLQSNHLNKLLNYFLENYNDSFYNGVIVLSDLSPAENTALFQGHGFSDLSDLVSVTNFNVENTNDISEAKASKPRVLAKGFKKGFIDELSSIQSRLYLPESFHPESFKISLRF